MKYDSLGDRMKKYEYVTRTRLVNRCPVIIRLDGKAFHSFTKGLNKPFDFILANAMQKTMKYLCENIQGCVFGYTQSDEITLVLIDYKKLESCAWFDYNIQKCASISASMATMAFNKFFDKEVEDYGFEWKHGLTPQSVEVQAEHQRYMMALGMAKSKGAMFDARCFNVPKEDVANLIYWLIYWRQLDAVRNSIQMVGQAYFSHSELQGKSCNNIKDMLMAIHNINWDNYPTRFKRGSCCIKNYIVSNPYGNSLYDNTASEGEWIVDTDIPIFKGDGRQYIENLIYVGET